MTPRNRRTNESKSGIRDLAVKQSAAGRVKGGETSWARYRPVTVEAGGAPSLGYLATQGAAAAGTGAAG